MAPYIEDFEKIIGRRLKGYDVLIKDDGSLYEVVEPTLEGNLDRGCVEVKILTPVGSSSNHISVHRSFDIFKGIIKVEGRTDIKQDA